MVDDVPVSLLLEKLQKLKLLAEDRFLFVPLRNKVGKIVNELKRILTIMEQENDTAKTLLAELLPILDSTEYTIESFLLKTTQSRQKGVAMNIIKMPLFAFAPWIQIQLSCKMKEIKKKIRAVSMKFGEVDMTVCPILQALGLEKRYSNSIRHHYDEMPDLLIGRGDAEKELVGRLIKDEQESLRVISIVSQESIGKTALAKKVYDRLDIRQHFQCRAWVHVPEYFTFKDLLLIITAQVAIGVVKDIELMSEDQLCDMLFQICMEFKFLIVLDNVRKVDDWIKFVRLFADTMNGSKIILTTRSADVASQADPWSSPLGLKGLTDKDSWVLFLNKVNRGRPEGNNDLDINADHLSNIREKILKICGGVPPAIVLLGGVLSKVGLSSEWSRVIDHLSQLSGEDNHSELLSSILALSYRELPFLLRPCFVYLVLFPKMYDIPIRRLLHLWLAEGFVQLLTKATSITPEDMAQSYFEELVCRNMIEISRRKPDGSPKTCRLPCFIHDSILQKAKDTRFLHVHDSKSDHKSSDSAPQSNYFLIRRLADQYFSVGSTSTDNLCSYLSFETQKRNTSNREIETLLQRIMKKRSGAGLLKVFDIESIYRPVLPDNLGELQNLTYIGLRWTGLNSCPSSIGDLPFLETLDLKYTNITTLPSSIWKAKRLRHLYMNEVSIPKPSKEPSRNLQTLMGLDIGSKDPSEYWLNQLTSLRKLRLTCHSNSVGKTIDCISRLSNLQTFKLRSRDPFGQPVDISLGDKLNAHPSLLTLSLFGVIKGVTSNLPQNLKTLTLSMSQLDDEQMQLLAELPHLNILGLLASSYAGRKMILRPGNFPELRIVKLWLLENLEQWTVKEGGMPKLEELEIRGCENLKRFDGVEHLPGLKEFVLTNMPPDFVAGVKESMRGRDILLTNEWKASSSLAFGGI